MAASPTESPVFTRVPTRPRGNGVVVAFALLFVGFGLHLIVLGVGGLLGEDSGSEEVMQLAGGFIFAAMGSLFAFLMVRDGRERADLAERSARHPDEPWRWRADWASGRILCASKLTALGFLAFAVIWNAFCIPMLWSVPSSDAPFVWIFVIAGMGFAVAAGLSGLRWLRFGRSLLELTSLPGRPGGRLRGTIHLRGAYPPQHRFRATLSCIRFSSGRNSQERTLWQEEGLVPVAAIGLGPAGLAVPVDFPIPGDAEASSLPGTASGIRWRVELGADLPGVDFAASFEVPVFHGDGPATPQDDADDAGLEPGPMLQPEASMLLDRDRYTPDSRNRVCLLSAGVVEVRLPAARNVGQALFFTAVTFVWSFFAALAWFAAPLVFGVAFVGAWVLLVLNCVTLWLRSRRIVADRSGVAVTSRFLGIGWTRRIPADAIEKLVPQIADGSGKRPYYDFRLHRRGARSLRIGDGVRSKREAEWLCSALRGALQGSDEDDATARSDASH